MKPQIIHLETKRTSYILSINHFAHLENIYYGAKVQVDDVFPLLYKQENMLGTTTLYDESLDPAYSLDHVNLELGTYGKGDYRPSSLILRSALGFTSDFKVNDFRKLETFDYEDEGLPVPHDADECYEFDLVDELTNVMVTLRYLVFKNVDVIARSIKIHKSALHNPVIEKVMSLNLDLYNKNYEVLSLHGTWANEAHLTSFPVQPGTFKIESITGPSSNRQNPFVILKASGATLDVGEYFGVNLMYSGPFEINVHLNPFDRIRLQAGINHDTFSFDLSQEDFVSPWVALSYANNGQNGLSQNFHDFTNDHVVRKAFSRISRPVLLNNWEATYFNFDEKKLVTLMKKAKELGIEMLVLDDGWFIERDNDFSGLGNYEVNRKKLPHGLAGLVDKAKKLDLKFGLWFEPEMVSEQSEVAKKHPEWILRVPTLKASKGRHQLAFDLTQKEVQDYIIDNVSHILNSADISYVKWDYNRNLSDIYSRSNRHTTFFYDYTKGLYRILKTLTDKFPHILWEGCASGGNRFDLGVLHYFDQIWASDCSDGYERVRILKNLALVYPITVISAHVSDVPNHQMLREVPLNTRFNVAFFSGGFGYELDISNLTKLEERQVKMQCEFYKTHRDLVMNGDFFALKNDTKYQREAFALISKDKNLAVVSLINGISTTMPYVENMPSLNLDVDKTYQVLGFEQMTNIHKFGGLLKMVLPKFIKHDGVIINTLAKRKTGEELIKVEVKENYTVSGTILKNGALRLYPQWTGTGVNDKTRVLSDFGSTIYSIYTKE